MSDLYDKSEMPVNPALARPTPVRGQHLAGLVSTVALHGGLALAVVLHGMFPAEEPEQEVLNAIVFEDVQLLALGEEKPPQALPRIANPAPPPPQEEAPPQPVEEPAPTPDDVVLPKPTDTATPTPTPTKPVETEEDRRRREHEKRQKLMDDALSKLHDPNRPVNDDTPEGRRDGVVGGTVSDAAMASLMGTYQAKLLSELARFWQLPTTISPDEARRLAGQVSVYVRLADSGHVVTYKFRARSTNEQFNDSIERLLTTFQVRMGGRQLPLPDQPDLRREIVSRGLELTNWESLQR